MKVLIVPMAAQAETAGPCSRASALAKALKEAGIGTATCAAMDLNFRPLPGIDNYSLGVPPPLGLPTFIARHTFPIAQKLGITSRKAVHSFEEVLFLTGNLAYPYLKKSVSDIRAAIAEYMPDIVYSEFNISAIIAARLERLPLYVTVSRPTMPEYASSARFSSGLRRYLTENNLPPVDSCLELFSWADKRFVPSCPELEPMDGVTYCGSWKTPSPAFPRAARADKADKIPVYMGNGTISPKKSLRVISTAFRGSGYELYFAGREYPDCTRREGKSVINTSKRFDFGQLLPDSVLFINHGGQNSIADGLIYGVPQIICPGRVFERIYNARSIESAGAGIMLPPEDFSPESIARAAEKIISDRHFRENAAALGYRLLSLGGIGNIVNAVKTDIAG